MGLFVVFFSPEWQANGLGSSLHSVDPTIGELKITYTVLGSLLKGTLF